MGSKKKKPKTINKKIKEKAKIDYLAGMEVSEIAKKYDVNPPAVYMWVLRGKWKHIRETGEEPPPAPPAEKIITKKEDPTAYAECLDHAKVVIKTGIRASRIIVHAVTKIASNAVHKYEESGKTDRDAKEMLEIIKDCDAILKSQSMAYKNFVPVLPNDVAEELAEKIEEHEEDVKLRIA